MALDQQRELKGKRLKTAGASFQGTQVSKSSFPDKLTLTYIETFPLSSVLYNFNNVHFLYSELLSNYKCQILHKNPKKTDRSQEIFSSDGSDPVFQLPLKNTLNCNRA